MLPEPESGKPSWRTRDRIRQRKPVGHGAVLFYSVACAVGTLAMIVAVAAGIGVGWGVVGWFGCVLVFATIATVWESRLAVRRVKEQLALGNVRRARALADAGTPVSRSPVLGVELALGIAEGRTPEIADPEALRRKAEEITILPWILPPAGAAVAVAGAILTGLPVARIVLLGMTVLAGLGAAVHDVWKALLHRRIRRLIDDGHVEVARALALRNEVDYVLDLGLAEVFTARGKVYRPLFEGLHTRSWAPVTSFVVGLSALLLPLDPWVGVAAMSFVHLLTMLLHFAASRTAVIEALTTLEQQGEEELAERLEQLTGGKDEPDWDD